MSGLQSDRNSNPDLNTQQRSADPTSNTSSQARTTTPDLRAERRVFFFAEKGVFLPINEGLARHAIRSHPNRCDCSFFDELKANYRQERGWLRFFFGLYTFSHCDFHKFHEFEPRNYDEHIAELPNISRLTYYYQVVDFFPPINRKEFHRRFWNTSRECRCRRNSSLVKIPQKVVTATPMSEEEECMYWGIVAREKKAAFMVLVYCAIAALPLPVSVWFFFYWLNPGELLDEAALANHRDNLSNAFVPLGISIALFMAVATFVR